MTHPEYVLAGLLMLFFVVIAIISAIATLVILTAPDVDDRGWAAGTMFLTCVSVAFAVAVGVIFHGGFMGS